MPDQKTQPNEALEALLEYERESLLQGALDHIVEISDEKIRLTNLMLNGRALDTSSLKRIRYKAGRNQKLLAASVRAVRFVNGRLNTVSNQGKLLNTYNKSGRTQQIGGNNGVRFEQRS